MKTNKKRLQITRRSFLRAAGLAGALGGATLLSGCDFKQTQNSETPADTRNPHQYDSLLLDMSKWSYDEEHDIYYLLDVPYCQNPVSKQFETISIYVPGAYFSSEKKGDYYTCELLENARVGQFVAGSLPCIFPVNCANYSAQRAQNIYSYDGLKPYLGCGAIYVMAGCRGRAQGYDATNSGNGFYEGGAVATIVDLKAAIRFLRLNQDKLGISKICAFGVGQGGFLTSLLGVSGDADFYTPFLTSLGASAWNQNLEDTSDMPDAICAWTPELSLPNQDAAYEWLFGQYMHDASRTEGVWTDSFSKDLAKAWAEHVNESALVTNQGTKLVLESTAGGVYVDGSLYQELLAEATRSAKEFFANTSFPATLEGGSAAKAPFPADNKDESEAELEAQAQDAAAAIDSNTTQNTQKVESFDGTYRSREAYIASLNKQASWFSYAAETSSVHIDSLRELANRYSKPEFSCTAFDGLEAKTIQNQLFGTSGKPSLHFSRLIADILTANMSMYSAKKDWSDAYTLSWATDLETEDAAGNSVSQRATATDQFTYLEQEANVKTAPFWRIRAGLQQGEIPWAPIFLFAKAVSQKEGVQVDYATSWQGGINLCEAGAPGIESAIVWLEETFGQKG